MSEQTGSTSSMMRGTASLGDVASISGERVMRVFISSTFRDMQEERELLVKEVFPELRRVCSERSVVFTEVDLRWGITEEQQAEGRVLPICLEEIARSRPYFIGLLGERYGWIPNGVPPELLEREPWLREHVGGRTSVTELEIMHGVLNNLDMKGHAFFYFRDPEYVNSLPERQRLDMVEQDIPAEVTRLGKEEARRRTEERRRRLVQLKERIRRCHKPVMYANPRMLAEAVRQQFRDLIERLYPEDAVPDALVREARSQEAYARGKLLAYVDRPSHAACLNAFVSQESTGKGLVLTGPSGGGKSALLASWVRQWRRVEPNVFIFEHYFGSTRESATVTGCLTRLLGELKRRFGIIEEIPTEPARLREAFPVWLAQGGGRSKIVLAMDGLNQIEGNETDRRLNWLPRYFPGHVRMLTSTLPGPGLESLRERGWKEYELPLATPSEREAIAEAYLKQYGRTLRSDLSQKLISAPGSANPLYLRTVLDELRQFGSFEELPKEVERYLEACTPQELFRLVIRRWQKDFDGGKGLVRRALRHLWAARQGLAETEWLELLAADGPLPRQEWTPLFLAMEAHLSQRAGLFAYGHDFLRQAVRAECVGDDKDARACHLALGDHFQRQEKTVRNLTELPWQLREANERDRLRQCLLDVDNFVLMKARDEYESLEYWVGLREERTMGKAYLQSFEKWSQTPGRAEKRIAHAGHELGLFLFHASLYVEAEPLMKKAAEIGESVYGKDHPVLARILSGLALLFLATNRPAETEPLMRRVLEIDEKTFGKDHPVFATHMNNLAEFLLDMDRFSEAEPMIRRALEIHENAFGKDHREVGRELNSLARLLMEMHRWTEAEPLMRRSVEICEDAFGKDHVKTAIPLHNLASLLMHTDQIVEAEALMKRALKIFEGGLGTENPRLVPHLNDLASLFQATNRLAEAMPLMKRALKIDEDNFGEGHPSVARDLRCLATLLEDMGQLAEAEDLTRRALKIDEDNFGKNDPNVATDLNNLGLLLLATQRYGEAEALMTRALDIMKRHFGGGHFKVATYVRNLALLLSAMNRYTEAGDLMRTAEEIDENCLGKDHVDVAEDLQWLARLFQTTNRCTEAETMTRRALAIFQEKLGRSHPKTQKTEQYLDQLLAEKVEGTAHREHADGVCECALSADGMQALSGSHDKTLKIWDVETGQCIQTLTGHTKAVVCCTMFLDGKRVLSGAEDGDLKVWDLERGDCMTLIGHKARVCACCVSPDGTHAISVSEDKTLRAWNVETGECIAIMEYGSPVTCCHMSADGRIAMAGDSRGHVHFLRLMDDKQESEIV